MPGIGNLPIRVDMSDLNTMQHRIVEVTWHYLELAEQHFAEKFKLTEIDFSLRGRSAGYFKQFPDGRTLINYNPVLLEANGKEFISRTAPHEVAHLVAFQLYGSGIRPHGKHWQMIMELFKADATRCHAYDVNPAHTRQYQRFEYQCECQLHFLTAIRHNRVLAGQSYLCKKCRQPLMPC